MYLYNFKLLHTLGQGSKATLCLNMAKEKTRGTRRRKPTKEEEQGEQKRKSHSINTPDEAKMAMRNRKNF